MRNGQKSSVSCPSLPWLYSISMSKIASIEHDDMFQIIQSVINIITHPVISPDELC